MFFYEIDGTETAIDGCESAFRRLCLVMGREARRREEGRSVACIFNGSSAVSAKACAAADWVVRKVNGRARHDGMLG
jgi:hypothetical protein